MAARIYSLWYYDQKYDKNKLEKYRIEQLATFYGSDAFDQEINMKWQPKMVVLLEILDGMKILGLKVVVYDLEVAIDSS